MLTCITVEQDIAIFSSIIIVVIVSCENVGRCLLSLTQLSYGPPCILWTEGVWARLERKVRVELGLWPWGVYSSYLPLSAAKNTVFCFLHVSLVIIVHLKKYSVLVMQMFLEIITLYLIIVLSNQFEAYLFFCTWYYKKLKPQKYHTPAYTSLHYS